MSTTWEDLHTETGVPVGTWVIDPAHSRVGAVVRHMMVTKVRGHFREFSGTIHIDDDPARSYAEAIIAAASIDTNDDRRDAHLRSPDFLDADNHPEITFRSTGVKPGKNGSFTVTGELTMRGVTRPVTLEGEVAGIGRDPWGNERATFSAYGEIDREQFGLTWNQPLESGGVLVSKEVGLEIEASAVRQ